MMRLEGFKKHLPLVLKVYVLAMLSMGITGCAESSLHRTIKDLKFVPAEPPSLLHPPGTIVSIGRPDPFIADVECKSEDAIGMFVQNPSPLPDSVTRETINSTFQASGDYLRQLKADAKFKSIKAIEYTLSNARKIELVGSEVIRLRKNLQAPCRMKIEGMLKSKSKKNLGMVRAVLQADVVYTVSIDDEVNADISGILNGLAARLDIKIVDQTARTLSGKGLYWGVIDGGEDYISTLLDNSPIPTINHSVRIPANVGWTNTRVWIKPTDVVYVEYLTGSWNVNPGYFNGTSGRGGDVDANGHVSAGPKRDNAYLKSNAFEGQLVGRIGEDGMDPWLHSPESTFLIGLKGDVRAEKKAGYLYLSANDDPGRSGEGFKDNRGAVNVNIVIEKGTGFRD